MYGVWRMDQVIRAIKDINQTDVVVAAVSAVTCLGALLELPVWAVFIGWVWYLAIGANGKAIKEGAICGSNILGLVVGWLAQKLCNVSLRRKEVGKEAAT